MKIEIHLPMFGSITMFQTDDLIDCITMFQTATCMC